MQRKTYFIQDAGGRIKIGIANDPQQRIRQLQCGQAEKLTLLGFIDGDHEAELHRRFRTCRLEGEWFRQTQELVEFVEHTLSNPCPGYAGSSEQPTFNWGSDNKYEPLTPEQLDKAREYIRSRSGPDWWIECIGRARRQIDLERQNYRKENAA